MTMSAHTTLAALTGATALLATAGAQAAIISSQPISFTTELGYGTKPTLYAGSDMFVDASSLSTKVTLKTGAGASGQDAYTKAEWGDVIGPDTVYDGHRLDVSLLALPYAGWGNGYYGFMEVLDKANPDTSAKRYGWLEIQTKEVNGLYFSGSFTTHYNDAANAPIVVGQTASLATVAEPSGLAMLAAGLGGLMVARRRKAAAAV